MKSFLALTLFIPSLSLAHILMYSPIPLNGRQVTNEDPMTTNAQYPCQGYIPQYPFNATAHYTAGHNASIILGGTAIHNGGSCQFSLSYDNGTTFRVIESIIGGCPLPLQYDVEIPSFAPPGNALFAWTWFNKVGNREFYMNCAWVTIDSPPSSPTAGGSEASSGTKLKPRSEVSESYYGSLSARTQKQANRHRILPRTAATTTFNDLPLIFQANLPQFSHITLSGCDVQFPDAGPVLMKGISQYAWCSDNTTGYSTTDAADTVDDAGGIAAPSTVLPAAPRPTPTPIISPMASNYTVPGTAALGSKPANSSPSPIYPLTNTSLPVSPYTTVTLTPPLSPTPTHPTKTSTTKNPAASPASSSPGGQGAACSPLGAFACNGPNQFYTCDYGAESANVNGVWVGYPLVWTEVRPVAPGTRCVDGAGGEGLGAGFVAARRDV